MSEINSDWFEKEKHGKAMEILESSFLESAFPTRESFNERLGAHVGRDAEGMTLRDYFAAKAIDAAAADELRNPTYDEATYKGTAERAYLYADAMLRAREAK